MIKRPEEIPEEEKSLLWELFSLGSPFCHSLSSKIMPSCLTSIFRYSVDCSSFICFYFLSFSFPWSLLLCLSTSFHSSIHSFIHSDHFYSASSSPFLLRSTPDTARILCWSFTPKRHRQQWAKDLPKVPTLRLVRESNPRLSGWKL